MKFKKIVSSMLILMLMLGLTNTSTAYAKENQNPNNTCKEIVQEDETGVHIKKIYSDGSVLSYGLDLSEAIVTNQSSTTQYSATLLRAAVDIGDFDKGTGYVAYTNARVYHKTSAEFSEFYLDFYQTPYDAEITDYYNKRVTVMAPFTIDSVKWDINLKKNAYGDAYAGMKWNTGLDTGDIIGAQNSYLKITITPTNYEVDYHFYSIL